MREIPQGRVPTVEELLDELSHYPAGQWTEVLARIHGRIRGTEHAPGIDPAHQALLITRNVVKQRQQVRPELREAVLTVPETCVGIIDDDGCIVTVSHHFANLLGYRPEDLAGRSALQIAWDLEEAADLMAELRGKGKVAGASRQRHRDGYPVSFEFEATVYRQGGRAFYLYLGRELPEQSSREKVTELRGRLWRGAQTDHWAAPVAASGLYGCLACKLGLVLGMLA